MRIDLYSDWLGRLRQLDYKKLILIVFLARVILASAYDIPVSEGRADVLLPDSKTYSVTGKYVALLLRGYDRDSFTEDMLPLDQHGKEIFYNAMIDKGLSRWGYPTEAHIFFYLVGWVYFILGYHAIWIRLLNIVLSIGAAYLLFRIAKRRFGDLAANIFLLVALFLPTQFIYSLTLSKDILRMFVTTLILWGIYG